MKSHALTGNLLTCEESSGKRLPEEGRQDLAQALAVDTAGTVYVTGRSWGGASGLDYATVAYDSATGAELWVARYVGFVNQAVAIAVDEIGNVYVTGWSIVSTGRYDYVTIKYSQP